jgi:hypothetical protein
MELAVARNPLRDGFMEMPASSGIPLATFYAV